MGDGETGREEGAMNRGASETAGGRVRTPLGTMCLVLIYAVATIVLWSYVYYHMLRYGGEIIGH